MTIKAFIFESREQKKTYVERMFGQIAKRYDFFNHFLSFGFDYAWRRRAIEVLRAQPAIASERSPRILDIACGTGDLAFEALEQKPGAEIIGLDITPEMLELFRKKITQRGVAIAVERGDVEDLRFESNSVHAVTIGFGTRNFTNLHIAFGEIARVLKPGGVFINLELAKPRIFPMKQMYSLYFNWILPFVASVFSRHDSAYRYLPDSLRRFPDLEDLAEIMKESGFSNVVWETRTAGIVAIHCATK